MAEGLKSACPQSARPVPVRTRDRAAAWQVAGTVCMSISSQTTQCVCVFGCVQGTQKVKGSLSAVLHHMCINHLSALSIQNKIDAGWPEKHTHFFIAKENIFQERA